MLVLKCNTCFKIFLQKNNKELKIMCDKCKENNAKSRLYVLNDEERKQRICDEMYSQKAKRFKPNST